MNKVFEISPLTASIIKNFSLNNKQITKVYYSRQRQKDLLGITQLAIEQILKINNPLIIARTKNRLILPIDLLHHKPMVQIPKSAIEPKSVVKNYVEEIKNSIPKNTIQKLFHNYLILN
ncbi:hypothetical protein NZD85_05045 [Empedobacter stercoris]|uniref:hypothetical protein n=1 Tax=Empedobacter stercoris TaxID=1628248 RepID=UPI0021AFE815|nr:hypothetical protein [Empedobacter stercoris]UWX67974.1 hypothetical protein NZD85_05045 [Empedobacter stercoris]